MTQLFVDILAKMKNINIRFDVLLPIIDFYLFLFLILCVIAVADNGARKPPPKS